MRGRERERERDECVFVCVIFSLFLICSIFYNINFANTKIVMFILSMPDSYDLLDSQPFSIFRSQKRHRCLRYSCFPVITFNIITCLNLVIKFSSS